MAEESDEPSDLLNGSQLNESCSRHDADSLPPVQNGTVSNDDSKRNETGSTKLEGPTERNHELNQGAVRESDRKLAELGHHHKVTDARIGLNALSLIESCGTALNGSKDSLELKNSVDFIARSLEDGAEVFPIGSPCSGGVVPLEEVDEVDDLSDDLDEFPSIFSSSVERTRDNGDSTLITADDIEMEMTSREHDADEEHDSAVMEDELEQREVEEEEEEGQMDLTPPKDIWKPFHAMRRRELGKSSRHANIGSFAELVSGSVEMARRLVLHRKLEQHNGCVNALHFNETGRFNTSLLNAVGKWC